MTISLDAAAEVYREAMRQSVRRYSLWYLVEGVLLTLAGILAMVFPLISSTAAVLMLGWLLIFSGALQAINLISARHVPHFWLQLAAVLLSLIAGFLILRDPLQSLAILTLLVLVFFMLEGMSKIVFALTIRPLPIWSYVLASGVVGVLLSIFLLVNLPETAVWLVALLIGVQFIAIGVPLALMAWRIRTSP